MIVKKAGDTFTNSSAAMLRAEYPGVSFPSTYPDSAINPFGYYQSVSSVKPAYDPATEKLVETRAFVDDVATITWTVTALTAEEITAQEDVQILTETGWAYFEQANNIDALWVAIMEDPVVDDVLKAQTAAARQKEQHLFGDYWTLVQANAEAVTRSRGKTKTASMTRNEWLIAWEEAMPYNDI